MLEVGVLSNARHIISYYCGDTVVQAALAKPRDNHLMKTCQFKIIYWSVSSSIARPCKKIQEKVSNNDKSQPDKARFDPKIIHKKSSDH